MAKKKTQVEQDDFDLLEELGVETEPTATGGLSHREQRIIAGFEEIERFVEENGRLPQHGEELDIFERLYAVRLERIRQSAECRELLKDRDPKGLLGDPYAASIVSENIDDDESLLDALGVGEGQQSDISNLVYVRPRAERAPVDEVAQRKPCEDFHLFQPFFELVQQELESGKRKTIKFEENASIDEGNLFVVEGQKAFVAKKGEVFTASFGRDDCRLRVIYDNGTESDLLLRSMQKALYRDEGSRRIVDTEVLGPLFGDIDEANDQTTGYVYVLRSLSTNPFIVKHRTAVHKIGVTGASVKKRIAGAKKDPTYLLADVEIVAEYKLANINRKALEALIHKFFSSARLDLELKDRFGSQVEPKEWFLVPLASIDEAIQKIREGTIDRYRYSSETAKIISV